MKRPLLPLGSVCLELGNQRRWHSSVHPNFDRRHNINLVGNAKLGKDEVVLSVRWNLGTGFPFTPTQGYYQELISWINSAILISILITSRPMATQVFSTETSIVNDCQRITA